MYLRNCKLYLLFFSCYRFCFRNNIFLCIQNLAHDLLSLCHTCQKALDFNRGIFPPDLRCDFDSISAIIRQIKMRLLHCDQIYIPVQSPVKCKISILWIYFIIRAVIYCNDKKVLLLRQGICKLCPPGRISAVMMV